MSVPPPPGAPQKFTFDTEFFEVVGSPAPARPAAGAPPPLTRGPAINPRQQAYNEGYTTGLAEGQQQAQADLARVQQHAQNTLLSAQKALDDREKQILSQSLALLRATLHHLIGHVVQHYPDELLEHHLKELIPLLKTDEALTLRLHPSARGYHEKLALPHAQVMGLPMHIVSDTRLGPTDALIEWKNGGVESKLAQHLEAITRLLAGAGIAQLPVPPLATTATPPAPPTPPAETPDPLQDLASKQQSRAAELLGDDELVDALKPK